MNISYYVPCEYALEENIWSKSGINIILAVLHKQEI